MNQPLERLAVHDFKGGGLALGRQYGESFAGLLEGFYVQECAPDPTKLRYAAECLPLIRRFAPASYEFLRGVAQASALTLQAVTLLSLHEELYHPKFGS